MHTVRSIEVIWLNAIQKLSYCQQVKRPPCNVAVQDTQFQYRPPPPMWLPFERSACPLGRDGEMILNYTAERRRLAVELQSVALLQCPVSQERKRAAQPHPNQVAILEQ